MVEEEKETQMESFKLNIKFEKTQNQVDFLVLPTTTVQDIRRVLNETFNQFTTCYSLYFNDFELKDFMQIQEVPGIESAEKLLVMKEREYTELDHRIHISRFRELTTMFKSNIMAYGINQCASNCALIDPEVGSLAVEDAETPAAPKAEEQAEQKPVDPELLELVKNTRSTLENNLALRLPQRSKENVTCYKDICLSSWNPVPLARKLKGDIYYIKITTLESTVLEITCSVTGYFVNQSTASEFSPKNSGETVYSTLVELLNFHSALFKERFSTVQNLMKNTHPFEYLMTVCQTQPWLVKPAAQLIEAGKGLDDSFFALEALDTLASRDWNDDIQTAKELPKESGQERVERDQAMFRSHADFVDAAIKGAMLVVNKSISPLNPLEDELSQMYLHNNIFFSEGYDNKQIDRYGGADASHVAVSKDIDGIKLVETLDLEGIHTLGTVMIDYRGHRIVAQSIVPGILKRAATQESSIQYGSVDGGLEILADPSFDEPSSKLAEALHIAPHKLLDQDNTEHTLNTSVETKWVYGTDSRKYCLDLYRVSPVDATFLETILKEKESNPYPHTMVLLRAELVELFYEHKLRLAIKEYQEKNAPKDVKEGEETAINMDGFEFSLRLNPDVFTQVKLSGTKEEIEADENLVKEASGFISVSISQLLIEMMQYGLHVPVDGIALTRLLHNRGINMRYLGTVLGLFEKLEKSNEHFKILLKEEMVARAVKKILRDRLVQAPIHKTGHVVSDVLNALFGIKTGTSDQSKELQQEILKLVKSRFRYELQDETWEQILTPALLRSICFKVGIQIEAREYDFNSASCFQEDDILNLYPIVKSASPRARFGLEAHEHGRLSISQGQKDLGIELIKESISMYEQCYGPIHPETAKAYANLSMIYFNNKEMNLASKMQRRTLISTERSNGIDDSETLKQYLNLGYFEFSNGRELAGWRLTQHALAGYLFLLQGRAHTDIVAIYMNMALMLQKLDLNDEAVKYLEMALKMNIELFGEDSAEACNSQEALTRAYFAVGDYRKALSMEQLVYKFHKIHSGADDVKTKNASLVMKTLTAKAVEKAKLERSNSLKTKK